MKEELPGTFPGDEAIRQRFFVAELEPLLEKSAAPSGRWRNVGRNLPKHIIGPILLPPPLVLNSACHRLPLSRALYIEVKAP